RRDSSHELVIILLIGETPTWGVHREALRTALDLAKAVWVGPCGKEASFGPEQEGQAAAYTPPILGPAMSGTTESLRVTVSEWFRDQRHPGPEAPRCGSNIVPPFDLEFISGSATVDDNQGTLGKDLERKIRSSSFPGFNSSFHATVHPESAHQRFVLDYLVYRLGVCRIAALTESSTSYGEGWTRAADENKSRSLDCKDGAKVRLVNLPFPLHISKLQGPQENGDSATGASSSGVPRRLRALERDEDVNEPDSFPAKSRVTQSAAEVSLEEVLAGIATEEVQAVVIVATSTADVLFLVEKVRRSFPNVTIVVNDADITFLHDDASFMEGVLTASTYSLSPWTPRLTFPFEGDTDRLLFPRAPRKGLTTPPSGSSTISQLFRPSTTDGRSKFPPGPSNPRSG
ncbi:MAG TPA: hypothetical protein VN903_04430, partial [Polyangia bacterium]|nr:hypothetical protein [Polyangia bacterium]